MSEDKKDQSKQKQYVQKSHAYLMVSNNPQLYYPWAEGCDCNNSTKEQLTKMCEDSLAPFHSNKHKSRSPEINGAMCVAEASGDGTLHVHHVFFSKNRLTFESLQKAYPHSHIMKAYGDAESNRNYIFKEGNEANEAKKHTQLCDPVVWGEWFMTDKDYYGNNVGFDAGSLMERIKAMIEDGMTPDEIYVLDPKYAYYHGAIERTYAAKKNLSVPLRRKDKQTWYHFGLSGTGKTEVWDMLLEEQGEKQVCKLDSGPNMFDSYDYSPTLVLDDVKGDHYSATREDIRLVNMLGVLDVRACTIPCRYADKTVNPKNVHVTSVYPPEKIYHYFGEDTFEQLRRRLNYVVYHWKDDEGNFRKFELPAEEYTDYASLKARALKDGGKVVPWREH